jgi:hypothetical protein
LRSRSYQFILLVRYNVYLFLSLEIYNDVIKLFKIDKKYCLSVCLFIFLQLQTWIFLIFLQILFSSLLAIIFIFSMVIVMRQCRNRVANFVQWITVTKKPHCKLYLTHVYVFLLIYCTIFILSVKTNHFLLIFSRTNIYSYISMHSQSFICRLQSLTLNNSSFYL